MNKLFLLISCMAAFFINESCNSDMNCFQKLDKCINDEVSINKNSLEGQEFTKKLRDTILINIRSDVDSKWNRYKSRDFIVTDICLFDSLIQRGIGFVIQYRKEGGLLDYVNTYMGYKKNDKWIFSDKSLASFTFKNGVKYEDKTEPISKDTLIKLTLQNIIKYGYYKDCFCNRDFEAFDKMYFSDSIEP